MVEAVSMPGVVIIIRFIDDISSRMHRPRLTSVRVLVTSSLLTTLLLASVSIAVTTSPSPSSVAVLLSCKASDRLKLKTSRRASQTLVQAQPTSVWLVLSQHSADHHLSRFDSLEHFNPLFGGGFFMLKIQGIDNGICFSPP